jgi:hypothetical protein
MLLLVSQENRLALFAAGINAPKPIIVSIQTCNVDTEPL